MASEADALLDSKNSGDEIGQIFHVKIKRGVFTRKRLLVFFTACSLVNYFDRGVIGGALAAIEDDFGLSTFEGGLLGGAFMIGFMICCPMFALLSHRVRAGTLMAIGLSMWTLAAVAAALSRELYTLGLARMLIGIGEASFAGLAPTYIDDIAPKATRTTWLAIFYSSIPIGAALGYATAGAVTTISSWRTVFILEAIFMIPCVWICIVLPRSSHWRTDAAKPARAKSFVVDTNKQRSSSSEDEALEVDELVIPKSSPPTFLESLKEVTSIPVYNFVVLGYSAQTFVIGGLAFWVPEYVVKYLGLKLHVATTVVGAVTVVTGLVGTAFGGILMDKLGGTESREGIVKVTCLEFLCACILLPFAVATFLVDAFWLFVLLNTVGQFVLFASSALLGATLLSVVPQHQRSFGMALNIFTIHLLGDFPSPVLVGFISDQTTRRIGMLCLASWTVFAIVFFFLSWIYAKKALRKSRGY